MFFLYITNRKSVNISGRNNINTSDVLQAVLGQGTVRPLRQVSDDLLRLIAINDTVMQLEVLQVHLFIIYTIIVELR